MFLCMPAILPFEPVITEHISYFGDLNCHRVFMCIITAVLQAIRKGEVRQNTTVLYPIYYADNDMFRPLWAIFRSQKYI